MEIKILKAIPDEKRGRVLFFALVDGKKKEWNVAKKLYEVIKYLVDKV